MVETKLQSNLHLGWHRTFIDGILSFKSAFNLDTALNDECYSFFARNKLQIFVCQTYSTKRTSYIKIRITNYQTQATIIQTQGC